MLDHTRAKEEEREECWIEDMSEEQEKCLVSAGIYKTNIDWIRNLTCEYDAFDCVDVCKGWLYEPQMFLDLLLDIMNINWFDLQDLQLYSMKLCETWKEYQELRKSKWKMSTIGVLDYLIQKYDKESKICNTNM